jgi:dimethylamine/trimethylamine dehydrogenase
MGGQQTQTAAGGIENRAERGRAERPPANRGRRDPRHDVLFTPLQIGPKQTPNRFYQVPQCGPGGTVKPWTQAAHRGLKAEGGWGVVCVEETNVSRDADQTPLYMGTLWDDADAARYSLVCDAVHEHGSLAGVELAHGGLRSWNRGSRWPHLAPSPRAVVGAVSGEAPTAVARAMDLDDIRRVQNDFAVAAERAIVAGFDIVYVYASAGFLPAQFLSPQINRRADAYGGSFENRARFLLETLRRVREAVDGRAAVAVRIAVDRGTSPPYAVDPTNLLALIALADELVDLWDINDGGVDWTFAYGGLDSTSARFYPEGYLAQLTTELRSTTDKPIVGVARLTDPTTMARIIDAGIWDLIGAARPSIADPFLPAKIAAGRYDEVRECTGSNLCILTVRNNGVSACVQNATAMEEHRRGWHPERFTNAANRDRDVLIIGAGPAGMECAIVLAKRGFTRIHLADAAPDLGGHLRWVSRLPGMGSWARIVDWRRIQIAKLRAITPVLGTELDLASARIYGAHIIIVAAGARWAIDGIDPWSADPIPGLSRRRLRLRRLLHGCRHRRTSGPGGPRGDARHPDERAGSRAQGHQGVDARRPADPRARH